MLIFKMLIHRTSFWKERRKTEMGEDRNEGTDEMGKKGFKYGY